MTYVLALHPDGDIWKIALVHIRDKKPEIAMLKSLKTDEKPLEVLKSVLHKKTYVLASALEAEHWILRKLDLEIKGWKNILATIPFQAEDLLPFPKEQTILIPSLEEETSQGSRVRLIATKRELLEAHVSSLKQSGIDPHAVTTTVHALKKWAHYCLPTLSSFFLVYAHKENGFVAFIHKNELVEFKTLSFEKKGMWQRVKEYMLSLAPDSDSIPWAAAGHTIFLDDEEGLPWQPIEPTLVEYALPIGIALETLQGEVQFRKDELKPVSLKQKESKLLRFSFLFLLGSFLALGPLGHWLLHDKAQTLAPRAHKAMGKLGLSVKEGGVDDLLEQLLSRAENLDKERQFGPHFPIVTWFIHQLSQATLDIQPDKLPIIASLDYGLRKDGRPHLDIEWLCKDKETAKHLKKRLQETEGLHIAKWKQQSQTYSISLEKL